MHEHGFKEWGPFWASYLIDTSVSVLGIQMGIDTDENGDTHIGFNIDIAYLVIGFGITIRGRK